MSRQKKTIREELQDGWDSKLNKDVFFISKKEEPQKNLFERVLWGKVLFAITLVYLSLCFMVGCYTIVDLKAQENQITQSTINAAKQTEKIKKEIAWMKTDEAIETIAREEIGMVQPGEVLIKQKDRNS